MALELIPVPLSDRKLVERFIRVPWYVNREHAPSEHWVAPLLMDRRDYLNPNKNPFFDHAEAAFWIAHKDGRDVARIAAVRDEDYIRYHEQETGYLGMFECPDDVQVAQALIDRAKDWLRQKGCKDAIGPLELSTNYIAGVLIEGFDHDPSINMPYNPPYYDRLLKDCGLEKAKDLLQWGYDPQKPVPERVARIADKVEARHKIQLRTMSKANWSEEVGRVLEIYNDAWEKNWGFVPLSEKEFRHIAADLKMVVEEDLALMAEVDGRPVAFSLAITDFNPLLKKLDGRLVPSGIFKLIWGGLIRPKFTAGRLILLGIRSEYRRRGIDSMLFVRNHQAAAGLGLTYGELGWTLEDNEGINKGIQAMGGEVLSRYRVYGVGL